MLNPTVEHAKVEIIVQTAELYKLGGISIADMLTVFNCINRKQVHIVEPITVDAGPFGPDSRD